MDYGLPTSINIGGVDYAIRSDFRVVLDIYAALNDPELEPDVRAYEVLHIFYIDADSIPEDMQQEAVDKCLLFLQGGQRPKAGKEQRLMDWQQDFPIIVGPVNRILGCETRGLDYLHWWTWLSAYYEIGDCLFSQVVSIRSKLASHKPLDKADREFYQKNREIVDLETVYTEEEKTIMDVWLQPKRGDVSDA